MKLLNRIVTRNATLWAYLAVAVPLALEYWTPTLVEKGGRWAVAATAATFVVNTLRTWMEKTP